jgi:hypothetical protein
MNGWLGLIHQGLSPWKKRQASLGALTVCVTDGWRNVDSLPKRTKPKVTKKVITINYTDSCYTASLQFNPNSLMPTLHDIARAASRLAITSTPPLPKPVTTCCSRRHLSGPRVVACLKSNHIGGLTDVLDSDLPVKAVYYNGYPGDKTTWSDFVTAVANKGLILTAAQFPKKYTWGSVTPYILNPATDLTDPETNDASVVILFDKQDNEFLFTGDMDSTIEATVVARGKPLAAEVLKVGHHGSKYSSSADFLNAVQPKEAVICVGNNSYGHPSDDTLLRLDTVGAHIWRTDEDGTVRVDSDGFTWQVIPEFVFNIFRYLYLPLVLKPQPPTPSTTGNIDITNIFYDGAGSAEPDEYVEIRNNDTNSIQVKGWTLRDEANHTFTFPSFVMTPGQVCRVYTNENHPE